MIITSVAANLDWIKNAPELALDIESSGLNTRKEKVIGFGVSDGVNSAYFVHLSYDGASLQEVLPFSYCQDVLRSLAGKRLICYNASFDLRMIANYNKVDLLPHLHADAMLAFHTLNEEGVPFSHKPFALKTVAAHFFGKEVVAEQDDLKASIKANGGAPSEFYKADTTIMAKYCMQDCKLTFKLYQKFDAQLRAEGLAAFFYDSEVMPLYREVTIPMESRGIPVDVAALSSANIEITEDLQKLEASILGQIQPLLGEFTTWFLNKEYPPKRTGPFAQAAIEMLGPNLLPRTASGAYSCTAKSIEALPEGLLKEWLLEKVYLPQDVVLAVQQKLVEGQPTFNLLSKHHLKKIFFDKLGETPENYTDLGAPQVDEEFLEKMAVKYPWAADLITFNKLNKIKGTYIERFLEQNEDGIYYPSFFQHRTVSGRYASDLQQLSRPLEPGQADPLVIKHNNRIRHFFSSQPGYCLIEADYESLEPKVFAHVSTDERLKDIFRKGHDFYATIAVMTEGLTEYSADKKAPNYLGKMNKAKRQAAKPYSLGIPYGMSGYKLQFELNIPQKEADQLVKNYLSAFPDLHNWMQQTAAKVYSTGKIQVETGRMRRFPRAVTIYKKYGEAILDDLQLWKKYNESAGFYAQAKKDRREFKNYINNGANVQIQGLAASIVNLASIEINRRFKKAGLNTQICLQVHDSIATYGPISEAPEACKIMQEVMENNYKISVPLLAEPKVGRTYADTK